MKSSKILVLIIPAIILAIIVVFWPRGIDWDTYPEFSVILVDNGENDYIVVKFISLGTGSHSIAYLENIQIGLLSENNSQLFTTTLSSELENMSPGENVRIVPDADIIENGKAYKVVMGDPITNEIFYARTIYAESENGI